MKKLFFIVAILSSGIALAQEPDTTEVSKEEKTNTPKIIYYQSPPEENDDTYRNRNKSRNKSQIKTLAGSMRHSGGFGALSFRATEFRDKTMVLAGARGGWIINRTLGIGVEGHGIIPTAQYDDVLYDDLGQAVDVKTLGGYGGLFLELIFFSNQVVHVTFPVSAGAGWIGFVEDWESTNVTVPRDPTIDTPFEDDVFWYVEPGANLELNIARNVRLDFGVSKRFTQDLELVNIPAEEFQQLNYYFTIKIGSF